jgi:hypothetical protein
VSVETKTVLYNHQTNSNRIIFCPDCIAFSPFKSTSKAAHLPAFKPNPKDCLYENLKSKAQNQALLRQAISLLLFDLKTHFSKMG